MSRGGPDLGRGAPAESRRRPRLAAPQEMYTSRRPDLGVGPRTWGSAPRDAQRSGARMRHHFQEECHMRLALGLISTLVFHQGLSAADVEKTFTFEHIKSLSDAQQIAGALKTIGDIKATPGETS